ncbi:MAG TPA: hypothetical protein VL048_19865 [Xanthobacteraceae bacterium]|nr:hypothetical protein [Xanthobacteraceae bacterium]
MSIIPFLRGQAFDPETIGNMSIAFERVCDALGLTTKPDPATEQVARQIIEYVQRGIHDVAALVDAVKNDFGVEQ